MKPLSVEKLRQMVSGLHFELEEEELTRLRPMVQDLLAVAQKLRHERSGGIDRTGPRERPAQKSG
jgi:ribosomal protein S13